MVYQHDRKHKPRKMLAYINPSPAQRHILTYQCSCGGLTTVDERTLGNIDIYCDGTATVAVPIQK